MQLRFRGAITFDTDAELEKAIQEVEEKINQNPDSFLSMEHIQPLGLHVTVHHQGTANQAETQFSREILKTLASTAYSGYVDMQVDDTSERFHAKEIDPKQLSVEDIADL